MYQTTACVNCETQESENHTFVTTSLYGISCASILFLIYLSQENFFNQVNKATESSAIFKINFWRHNLVQYSSPKVSTCFVTRHMVHFWYVQTFLEFKNAWLGLQFNVSSVVAFQGWWVLKNKLCAQESTCSKEILISTSMNPSSIYSWSIGHILEHKLFC